MGKKLGNCKATSAKRWLPQDNNTNYISLLMKPPIGLREEWDKCL